MDIAPTNILPEMNWEFAHSLVQAICIKDIVALEQKAEWHEDQSEEPDYSHAEAAKMCRRDAERIRHALLVLARGV